MSSIGPTASRTTALMISDQLLSALSRTQSSLLDVQNQISTGKQVTQPSDAPDKVALILQLQQSLNSRTQHDNSLSFAGAMLSNVDQALSDANNLVMQAQGVGSSQIGVGSSTDTRKNQATVLDGEIQALIDIANRQSQGVALFGGSFTPPTGQAVFVSNASGIQYGGTAASLYTNIGQVDALPYNSNGQEAFGALSTRMQGNVNLDPLATAQTRLAEVNGATGQGVRPGTIVLTVGTQTVNVDLTTADNLGEVATRIQNALNGVDPTAGAIAISGHGFTLTANAGKTLGIADTSLGTTAAALGIAIANFTGAAGGTTQTGQSVQPQLTVQTSLAALGVSVDLTHGLQFTQGQTAKTVNVSAAKTVQDLMNIVSGLGMGLRLEINSGKTGLNIISTISGSDFSVGEVGGGTTATDLGLRTFGLSTKLADFNDGLGVNHPQGQNDFSIQLHNGATFNVNLDGATTVGDVITAITTAAQTALGAANVGKPGQVGTLFNVGLASSGNGLAFEDATVGANNFQVAQLGTSLAATDLGIYQNAGNGNTITGSDNAKVHVDSVFSHLIALRDALNNDDTRGITLATSALQQDSARLTLVRADVGVRSQRVTQEQTRSSNMKLTEQSMLSDLQDTDMTTAITRFTQLQQQLQAGLKVGAQNLQLSLLDYLR